MDKSTRVYYIQLCNVLKIEALLEQNKKKWRVVFLMLFSPPSHIKIRKAPAEQKLTFETSPNVQFKYYSIYSTGIVPKWVKEGGCLMLGGKAHTVSYQTFHHDQSESVQTSPLLPHQYSLLDLVVCSHVRKGGPPPLLLKLRTQAQLL